MLSSAPPAATAVVSTNLPDCLIALVILAVSLSVSIRRAVSFFTLPIATTLRTPAGALANAGSLRRLFIIVSAASSKSSPLSCIVLISPLLPALVFPTLGCVTQPVKSSAKALAKTKNDFFILILSK